MLSSPADPGFKGTLHDTFHATVCVLQKETVRVWCTVSRWSSVVGFWRVKCTKDRYGGARLTGFLTIKHSFSSVGIQMPKYPEEKLWEVVDGPL